MAERVQGGVVMTIHRCWARPCRGTKRFPYPTVVTDPDALTLERAQEMYDAISRRHSRAVRALYREVTSDNAVITDETVLRRTVIKELEKWMAELVEAFPEVAR